MFINYKYSDLIEKQLPMVLFSDYNALLLNKL